MTNRLRTVHSNFETLRIASEAQRSGRDYHRFGSATNEQMTARGFGRSQITRPTSVFADFREV